MPGYAEIVTQTDLEALLQRVAGLHDSMVKELYVVNRAHVNSDHSMSMNHRFDARLLVQTQWSPFAIELLFIGVERLRTERPGECWGATGLIEHKLGPVEKRRVSLKLDREFEITAERLFVRDRSDWLGPKTRLGSEVPDPDCVPAAALVDCWRQCSACADAFEAKLSEVYAVCPACGRMTEFVEGTAEEAQKGASTPAEDSRIFPLKSPPRFRSK